MTIREAIDKADGLKPNQYTEADKVSWLSDLDTNIFRDQIMGHEHPNDITPFEGYTVDDMDKKLLVEDTYAQMYVSYILMKVDEFNGESSRYNNSAIMFNAYYDNFAKWWNKTHMPITGVFKFF